MQNSWWQELERELEQQFESFLGDHPGQQELLEQEEWREQQRRRQQRLAQIEQHAQHLRQQLLTLSGEIKAWHQRVERARQAKAHELASKASSHLDGLMAQGRAQWQSLAALGAEDQQLRAEFSRAAAQAPQPNNSKPKQAENDLESAWSRFEAEQELEQLRRQQRQ